LDDLSDDEIFNIFQEVQATRQERAAMVVKASHDEQALVAYESPLKSSLAFRFILPFLQQNTILNKLGKPLLGARRVEQLPDVGRSRTIHFDDQDLNRSTNLSAFTKLFLFALGLAFVMGNLYIIGRLGLPINSL
jgi:hypothetical protein